MTEQPGDEEEYNDVPNPPPAAQQASSQDVSDLETIQAMFGEQERVPIPRISRQDMLNLVKKIHSCSSEPQVGGKKAKVSKEESILMSTGNSKEESQLELALKSLRLKVSAPAKSDTKPKLNSDKAGPSTQKKDIPKERVRGRRPSFSSILNEEEVDLTTPPSSPGPVSVVDTESIPDKKYTEEEVAKLIHSALQGKLGCSTPIPKARPAACRAQQEAPCEETLPSINEPVPRCSPKPGSSGTPRKSLFQSSFTTERQRVDYDDALEQAFEKITVIFRDNLKQMAEDQAMCHQDMTKCSKDLRDNTKHVINAVSQNAKDISEGLVKQKKELEAWSTDLAEKTAENNDQFLLVTEKLADQITTKQVHMVKSLDLVRNAVTQTGVRVAKAQEAMMSGVVGMVDSLTTLASTIKDLMKDVQSAAEQQLQDRESANSALRVMTRNMEVLCVAQGKLNRAHVVNSVISSEYIIL